ncbi:unnamed protein product [marine sediment metagenome]|uniref:Uncharacterized protein n=1 Tax=marine sediment metagenome TaxID=412755 RepID=X0W5C6_9ZZZZ
MTEIKTKYIDYPVECEYCNTISFVRQLTTEYLSDKVKIINCPYCDENNLQII